MPRPIQQIMEEDVSRFPGDKETKMTHPAFGQISVFKTSGMTHMYGSDFRHQNYVSIELHHSELHRNLARDWPMQKDMITRFRMSEAQWAQFVSSFGSGGGTQVTLEYTHKDGHIPDIPFRDEGAVYIKEGQAEIDDAIKGIEDTIRMVEQNVTGLSKTKQQEILSGLHTARARLASRLPFITKSFEEHLENRVEKAKTEVNAWMVNTIQRAGLQAIAEQQGMPLQLEDYNADHHQEEGTGDSGAYPRPTGGADERSETPKRIRIIKKPKP